MTELIFNQIVAAMGVISGDSIGKVVGISKMAVNKHVKKLIARGIPIEISSRGYNYINSDTLDSFTLTLKLNRAELANITPIVDIVGSTNTAAKAVAKDYTGDFVFISPNQTQGRGRNKREFISEVGGLYMTYSLATSNLPVTESLNIVLLSGLAVLNVLNGYGIQSKIKWPNDVYVNDKKICGILLESNVMQSVIDRIYIGIGVNINNELADNISSIATSMRILGVTDAKREDVVVEIILEINRLIKEYYKVGQNSFKQSYLDKSWTIGRTVAAVVNGQDICGLATGITDTGYLIINNDGVNYIVVAGDVL